MPGPDDRKPGQLVEMVACHRQGTDELSAYERVLGDAMKGDDTLFARKDYTEEGWRIVDSILSADTPVHNYRGNSRGPADAETAVVPAGGWHSPIIADECEAMALQ